MNRTRILIVENEPIIALSLQAMLDDLDFISTGAVSTGREVLEAVKKELPDLVLMDISLDDDMDGIEAARIIHERHDIPVVFVTAMKGVNHVTRAMESGAFGYVTKPFDRANISNAIELALYRHAMEKKLRESEERFRIFAEYTCDWEYWVEPGGKAVYHAPSCQRMTGYSAEEFMAHPNLLLEIVHPEDAARVRQHISETCVGGQETSDFDFRIFTRTGEERWINHVCQPVHDDSGKSRGRRAGNRDITDRKHLELKMEHMAIHDGLTNLPNRGLLSDRLAQVIAAAKRGKWKMAVLFIDLDNFKAINDNYGHRVGDLTLKEVASRVLASVRHTDTVARFGGDEFVVVLSEVTAAEDATTFGHKVSQVLMEKFIADGKEIVIQASIGIALFPDHGEVPEELIAQADAAMYKAKVAGRQGVELASPEQERPE